MRVTAKPAAARTASARRHSELLQRISIFTLKMSATLKQFEDCAARCFEFARSATTTAGRAFPADGPRIPVSNVADPQRAFG
jgi:hypothetical protein